jgi:hypothetical protein
MKTRNINTVSVLAVLLALGLSMLAPAYGAPILIDFGNDLSYRAVDTPSPDGNGNYWTSVWAGAFYPDLLDINGNATAIDFGFSSAGGTDSYNGPAGATSDPITQAMIDATDIDTVALGNLGIKWAAFDFYVNSSFEIQGLDPNKTYNLTFFGSHKYNTDNTTVYEVYTDDTYTSLVDSASLEVGVDAAHNRDTVATITDLDPQEFNILYVKFIGAGGNSGYLNCMQIEEALPVKARNPVPSDGATLVPLTTSNLTWNEPSAYTPIKYVLSFRADDPNWLDAGTTVVDPVVDLDLDGDPATIEAAMPIALGYDTPYYWKVTTFEPNSPAPIQNVGPDWSFTTEPELFVDAGPDIITWLDGGGAIVDLNGTVSCPCVSSSVWSVDTKPAGSTVFITSPTSAVTTASVDTVGTYVLKLTAEDDGIPSFVNEDTATIQVFADACEAAKANPGGYTPLPCDTNGDCREDLVDFAQFAADWLEDLSLTENLEY